MKITFKNTDNSHFFATLKSRVDDYFLRKNISRQGDWRMVLKTLFIFSVFFCCYGLLISDSITNGWLALAVCSVLGMFIAFLGFNIAHDAVHGAYSSNPTINNILGYSFDMLGCSSYMWKSLHNIIHHTYTNIPNHDDDLEPVFFVRLNPTKKVFRIHKYQHWYATFFYGLTSLSWVFKKDFSALLKKTQNNEVKKHALKDVVILFTGKAIYYFIFLILPLLVLHFAWWKVLLGFIVMHFVEGLTLAIVFQLAHVVENTNFPEPTQKGTIQNNWAIHQLATTSDFARKSKLAAFFFGGLNFQVEHHLFPKICHIHYPELSVIVENTAKEFGIQYNSYKTMGQAIASHYAMLKRFGTPVLTT